MYPYDVPQNFGRVRVLFNRAFLQQCLAASDAIACSSNFTLHRLRQRAPEVIFRKAACIYQSAGLVPAREQAPANPKLCAEPFLLAVAQHRSNKNLDLLLSAFARFRRLRSSEVPRRLMIVGSEGPETRNLQSLMQRLGLGGHVLFQSNLPDAELSSLYRRCELLVVPSSVEGFCLPVVEALGCGSRVLCSDIPVLREVGGAGCQYFELQQRDPVTALAKAMDAALHGPAPVPYVSDAFRPASIAGQYYALYRRLIASQTLTTTGAQLDRDPARYDRYAS
jgi:glycosyltransferase involved in cell wall biosynthesis